MLVTILEADPFLGRMLTGRVESGRVKVGEPGPSLTREGKVKSSAAASPSCSPSAA
jgi:GTP-binding protein